MTVPLREDSFYDLSIIPFRRWVDGVAVSIVGILGLLGNLLTLAVLSRPKFKVRGNATVVAFYNSSLLTGLFSSTAVSLGMF